MHQDQIADTLCAEIWEKKSIIEALEEVLKVTREQSDKEKTSLWNQMTLAGLQLESEKIKSNILRQALTKEMETQARNEQEHREQEKRWQDENQALKQEISRQDKVIKGFRS